MRGWNFEIFDIIAFKIPFIDDIKIPLDFHPTPRGGRERPNLAPLAALVSNTGKCF